jgi:hypothetical protein
VRDQLSDADHADEGESGHGKSCGQFLKHEFLLTQRSFDPKKKSFDPKEKSSDPR